MKKTIKTEIRDTYDIGKPFPVRVEIHPSSVDIIIEGSGYDIATVAVEYYDGKLVGYIWDEDNIDQDPLYHADLVNKEEEDGRDNS